MPKGPPPSAYRTPSPGDVYQGYQQAPSQAHRPKPLKSGTISVVVGSCLLFTGVLMLVAALGLAAVGDYTADGWANLGLVLILGAISNLGFAAYRISKRIDYLYRSAGGQ